MRHSSHDVFEATLGQFTISTDATRLDVEAIHAYLARSYWAEGISRELVERSIGGSLCFGLYDTQGALAGFARVITDKATFAYLCDVFVLEAYRGRGLGKWLVRTMREHPELQGFRRWLLATRDAHGLYAQLGFEPLGESASRFMQINRPGIYRSQ